jgi:hypothetical protein
VGCLTVEAQGLTESQTAAARPGLDQPDGCSIAVVALDDIEPSAKLAQELGMDLEVGMSLRVQGQILLVDGQGEATLAAREQSLGILDGQDPNEAARTKLA